MGNMSVQSHSAEHAILRTHVRRIQGPKYSRPTFGTQNENHERFCENQVDFHRTGGKQLKPRFEQTAGPCFCQWRRHHKLRQRP